MTTSETVKPFEVTFTRVDDSDLSEDSSFKTNHNIRHGNEVIPVLLGDMYFFQVTKDLLIEVIRDLGISEVHDLRVPFPVDLHI